MSPLGGDRAPLAVSGVGLVSAAGGGFDRLAATLREGSDCVRRITHTRSSDLPIDTGGEIPDEVLATADAPSSRAARIARTAIEEAIADANRGDLPLDTSRTGLALGTVFGAIEEWEREPPDERERNPIDALARQLEESLPIRGPKSVFSMACTSGLCACEQAAFDLELGRAEAMVVSAVDTLGRVMQSGFCAMGSLGHRNPASASERGLVLGEAASAVVLEPLERVRGRGRRPRALLVAERLASDGLSTSAPDRSGNAMARAIARTLEDGGVAPEALGAITVTAAASPASAEMLQNALTLALGDALARVPITSFEPAIGHVLAATSVLVLAHASWLLERNAVTPVVELASGRVTSGPTSLPLEHPSVLALSVGLGGHNGVQLVVGASEPG